LLYAACLNYTSNTNYSFDYKTLKAVLKSKSKTIIKIALILASLIVIALSMLLYNPLPEQPSIVELEKSARSYFAEVIRDEWGVPHILGKTDADTSFGLAYVHAEDDYQTIQNVVAATRGQLARYNGMDAAPTDYIVALLNVWPSIEQQYKSNVPEDVKALAQGYAAGLNLYASRHLEDTWQGLAPFTAEDVLAGFMFKTPFFYGLDKTLLSLFDDERELSISLVDAVDGSQTKAFEVAQYADIELGSNGIAINAARSGDNTTRLLINSHQPLTGPVAWYEAHLKSEEGLNIMGGLFPGTPLILHGFNEHLAWANTVNHIDLADSYILTRNPDNANQYKLDGKWHDFESTEVNIQVRLFGPFAFNAKRKVLRTVHGPVIEGKKHTFAMRYAGAGEIRQLEQYYRLNKSQNLNQFMDAMAMNALPSINYVYADKDDNIGFIHNAQFPARPIDGDWSGDIPGDRSELIWQGYLDFEKVPKLINPQSGLVFDVNNTPFTATDGSDNLQATNFPQSMGLASDETNRSLRLLELLAGKSKVSKQALLDIKFDHAYSPKSEEYIAIQKITEMDWSHHQGLQDAAERLKQWDKNMDVNNTNASIAGLVLNKLTKDNELSEPSESVLQAAMLNAYEHLMTHHKRLDVKWGEINYIQRGDVKAPLDGGPDTLRAVYAFNTDKGQTYATNGDSWIAIVEWPKNEAVRADVIHQFGSATQQTDSEHHNNQLPLFAKKQWRQVDFDMVRIRQSATSTYQISVNKP
jgi:penicillin amidase/acyl-homoserine-lactone acylase